MVPQGTCPGVRASYHGPHKPPQSREGLPKAFIKLNELMPEPDKRGPQIKEQSKA